MSRCSSPGADEPQRTQGKHGKGAPDNGEVPKMSHIVIMTDRISDFTAPGSPL
jgi:hypothetical protein